MIKGYCVLKARSVARVSWVLFGFGLGVGSLIIGVTALLLALVLDFVCYRAHRAEDNRE